MPRRVERLGGFYPTPGFCDEQMLFYRCTELVPPASDSMVRKDEDEELEPRTVTVDEARAMVQRGDIVDMKTVVGLTLLRDQPSAIGKNSSQRERQVFLPKADS